MSPVSVVEGPALKAFINGEYLFSLHVILIFWISALNACVTVDHNSTILGIACTDLNIPCRLTVRKAIGSEFSIWKNELIDRIGQLKYVCQTADIWSTRTKSYMGITIHWIDAQLQRQSSALACRRFSGTHSYDRIASLLNQINNEFGISTKKIVATMTDNADNAANFCKAFKDPLDQIISIGWEKID